MPHSLPTGQGPQRSDTLASHFSSQWPEVNAGHPSPLPQTASSSVPSPGHTSAHPARSAAAEVTHLQGDQTVWPHRPPVFTSFPFTAKPPTAIIWDNDCSPANTLSLLVCLVLSAAWQSSEPDDPKERSVVSLLSPGGPVTLRPVHVRCHAVPPWLCSLGPAAACPDHPGFPPLLQPPTTSLSTREHRSCLKNSHFTGPAGTPPDVHVLPLPVTLALPSWPLPASRKPLHPSLKSRALQTLPTSILNCSGPFVSAPRALYWLPLLPPPPPHPPSSAACSAGRCFPSDSSLRPRAALTVPPFTGSFPRLL